MTMQNQDNTPFRGISPRAIQLARQFLGQTQSEGPLRIQPVGQPMPAFPQGLNAGNLRQFIGTPAGQQLVEGVRQRISQGSQRAQQGFEQAMNARGPLRPGIPNQEQRQNLRNQARTGVQQGAEKLKQLATGNPFGASRQPYSANQHQG